MWTVTRTVVTVHEVSFEEKLRADLAVFQIVTLLDGLEYEVDMFEAAGKGLLSCFGRIKGDTGTIKRVFAGLPTNEQINVRSAYAEVSLDNAVELFKQVEHLAR